MDLSVVFGCVFGGEGVGELIDVGGFLIWEFEVGCFYG